jgi:hypothetical protein
MFAIFMRTLMANAVPLVVGAAIGMTFVVLFGNWWWLVFPTLLIFFTLWDLVGSMAETSE